VLRPIKVFKQQIFKRRVGNSEIEFKAQVTIYRDQISGMKETRCTVTMGDINAILWEDSFYGVHAKSEFTPAINEIIDSKMREFRAGHLSYRGVKPKTVPNVRSRY
jgi:hypothetical protein